MANLDQLVELARVFCYRVAEKERQVLDISEILRKDPRDTEKALAAHFLALNAHHDALEQITDALARQYPLVPLFALPFLSPDLSRCQLMHRERKIVLHFFAFNARFVCDYPQGRFNASVSVPYPNEALIRTSVLITNQGSSLVLFWFTSSHVAAWRVSDNVAFGSNREIPCFGTQAVLCGPNLISLAQSPKTREILLRAFNYDSIIGMDHWSAAAVKAARPEKKIRVRLCLSLEAELLVTGPDSFMLVGRELDRDPANMRITSVNFTANLELGDIFYFTFNNTSLLSADEAANSVWHVTLQQTGFHHCWGLVFVVCKTVETTSILQGYVLKQRWYVVLAQTGTEPRNPVLLQESSRKLRIVNGQALEVDEGDSSHVTVTLNQ